MKLMYPPTFDKSAKKPFFISYICVFGNKITYYVENLWTKFGMALIGQVPTFYYLEILFSVFSDF